MVRTLALAVCAALAATGWAEQGDGFAMVSPMPTREALRVGVGAEDRPAAGVKHQDADFASERLRASADVRLYQDPSQELVLGARVARTWLDTGLVLPKVGVIPQRLDEIDGTATYRRFLGAGATLGGSLRIGSSSDEPFASGEEIDIGATLFTRQPVRGHDAWLLFLSYANDRPRFNHIPLPGVAYQWMPDERFTLIAGFPIVYATWKPAPAVAFDAVGSVFGFARAGATWIPFAPAPVLRLRAGWEWGSETYKRADREDRYDQLLFRDMKLSVGADVSPLRQLSLGLRAAWLFEREVFEGEGANDDGDAVPVASGWMFAASATLRL
jgi:hypothetical protein